MQQNYLSYMNLGLVYFMAYPFSMSGEGDILATVRDVLKDTDFGAIELTRINDPEVRRQVAALCKQSGVTVYYGAQPQLMRNKENINSLDESLRQRAVERMKRCIDEAVEMNAAGIAYLAGHFEQDKVEEYYQALVKSTCEICEYAKTRGNLPVNLEIFDYDVEKCSLIGPAPLAKRFAEEICPKYENFGLMIDLSHITQLRENFDENLDGIQPYIRHVHLATSVLEEGAPAYGDQHPGFYFDKSVVTEDMLAAFLRKLFQIGYLAEGKQPTVSFEVKPWGDEDSAMLIAGAKRFLQRAWEKV